MARPNRRDDVVHAAAQLIADHGLGDVSIKDVAEHVGMRPASVYRHFSSKEELFEAVLHMICDQVSGLRKEFLISDLSPEEKVKGSVYYTIKDHNSRKIHRKIMQRLLVDEDMEALELLTNRIYSRQHELIIENLVRIDPKRDPYFTYYSVLSLSLGYIHVRPIQSFFRHLTSKERDPKVLADYVLKALLPQVDWDLVDWPAEIL